MTSVRIKQDMRMSLVLVALIGIACIVSTPFFRKPMITFVCTGNTGRSVMAAYATEHKTLGKYQVNSRGVKVRANHIKPEKNALVVMNESHIDMSKHRAKELTKQDVYRAKLVLTMTKAQKKEIITNIAPGAGNVYLLSECADGIEDDISDVYNQEIVFYRLARDKIDGYLQKILERKGRCYVS